MRRYFLFGGICLLVSLYSQAQLGILHPDDAVTTDIESFEWLSGISMSSNGAITGLYPDGSTRYNAEVKNSRLHGTWKSWYPNNNAHDEGNLVKGVPNGEWKVWYPNGNLRFIRTYSSDKFKRITQEFTRPHPKMPNYPLTTIYQKDRRKATNRLRSSYSFYEALATNTYTPAFVNCLHHGLYMNFYESGLRKDSGFYKNGLRDGIWIEGSHENIFWTGTYSNGVKTGIWKQFAGKRLTEMVEYRGGREHWKRTYKN